jgi:hypothetical protein
MIDADTIDAKAERHAMLASDAVAARMIRAIGWIISGLLGNSAFAVVPRGGMVHSGPNVLAAALFGTRQPVVGDLL